jgi:hypothetical protein
VVVQRADALGHEPVEAADPANIVPGDGDIL